MGYQGNYPPSTPLNPTQLGTGVVTTDAIANGAVVPADLSTGAPSWDTSGQVFVGNSTNLTVSGVSNSGFAVQSTGGAARILISRLSNDISSPALFGAKSRSTTFGSFTAVASGDDLFDMRFNGDDGSTLNTYPAQIKAIVTGAVSTGVIPAALTFSTAASGNATERMRIDSSGRVGIGTSSPAFKLTVVGGGIQLSGGTTSQEGIRIQRASGYASITGINNDNNAFNPIAFFTGASEALRIDSSGNVGINSTNPTQYDTSGGRILNIRGTASNSSPATIFMNGNSSLPGAGYYTQEVFTIGVSASQEISRVTGTGANGFRSMIRISLCGHTGAKGNGHIYAMYYWDGGTAAPVQIFRYDSGTNIPGLSFNTSTSNVLITNLSSSDGSNQFQGVMMIEYFLPVDFAASTYTIS